MKIRRTRLFEDWLLSLRDREARLRIEDRLDRLTAGNPGQHRSVGGGVLNSNWITDPATAFTMYKEVICSSFCFAAETKVRKFKDIDRAKKLAIEAA